jgi:hypothetical protein
VHLGLVAAYKADQSLARWRSAADESGAAGGASAEA